MKEFHRLREIPRGELSSRSCWAKSTVNLATSRLQGARSYLRRAGDPTQLFTSVVMKAFRFVLGAHEQISHTTLCKLFACATLG